MQLPITTQHLSVWYKGFHALKDVSINIPRHSITALIGASGSGKSTFLRCVNRMIETIPQTKVSGTVDFEGYNVFDESTDVIELRRNVGMVFQNPTPFPKSIYDNIAYGLEIHQGSKSKRRSLVSALVGQSKIYEQEILASQDPIDRGVMQSLQQATLWDEVKDRLHTSAYRLSGGQQQRLCIARAIAVRPQVLLLDEPCSELDPISTHKIEQLLLQLKQQYTIVIVTHSMSQARRISDYVGFFHLGELLEFGTMTDIFEHAQQKLTHDYVHGVFG